MEAVHRYEGTVNQVMGDGIMALFGAPLAHEDHAVRACYAALRMQEAVKQYAEEVRRVAGRRRPDPRRAQLRRGGRALHRQRPAHGLHRRRPDDAPGRAHGAAGRRRARSCSPPDTLAAGRGLRAGEAARARAGQGAGEPVEVYELIGAGTARSRLQAAAARGLTRFVGRDAELEQLAPHARAGAAPGTARSWRSSASPAWASRAWSGSSPTRTAPQGWLVLESGSVSYGKATRYLPVIDLLKAYFGIEDRDDHARIREKVTGKLLTLDRRSSRPCPPLLALLDVPVDDAAWQALDPPQRRQRTLDALKRLLLRESQEQPLLLVVRGPALDRRRDPGAARQPGREPAHRAPPAAGQLPPRVPARLERQDLLPAAAARPPAAGERRGAAGCPARE